MNPMSLKIDVTGIRFKPYLYPSLDMFCKAEELITTCPLAYPNAIINNIVGVIKGKIDKKNFGFK